jgi:hypothetical protein
MPGALSLMTTGVFEGVQAASSANSIRRGDFMHAQNR